MLLFDSFMEHSGSLARSISSTPTVLSSMASYDQFPRFSAKTNATQLFFSTVLLPQISTRILDCDGSHPYLFRSGLRLNWFVL